MMMFKGKSKSKTGLNHKTDIFHSIIFSKHGLPSMSKGSRTFIVAPKAVYLRNRFMFALPYTLRRQIFTSL